MRRASRRGTSVELVDLSIAPSSPYDDVLPAPRTAKELAERAAEQFIERFNAGADSFSLDKGQAAALQAVIGQKGMPARMLASCIPLRLQLALGLIEECRKHWKQHRNDSGRKYCFGTIITDSGNILARDGHVDPEALRRKIDKLLREAKLDAVFVIEVQLLTNFPSHGHGGTHCWHVHFIGTTNDPDFDIKGLESTMRDSGRLSNVFGAPTVKLKPITSLAHLMRCCAYMLKPPAIGKRLFPHTKIPNGWTFKKVFVRQDEAFRLGEALSRVAIGQLVHSVGEGKHILRPAMRKARAWHKSQWRKVKNKLPAGFDVAKLWADIRGSRANNLYQPYIFAQKGDAPSGDEWSKLAAEVLATINAARAANGSEAPLKPVRRRSSANSLRLTPSALDEL